MRRGYSLAALLSALIIAVLLPLFLVALYGHYSLQRFEEASNRERLSEYASALAAAVDRQLVAHIETAEALAAAVPQDASDLPKFWTRASALADRVGGHFVLVERSGQHLANTLLPLGTALPRSRNPQLLEDVLRSGKPSISNLTRGQIVQTPIFFVRVPVRHDGSAGHMLNYVPRQNTIRDVVQQTYLPNGWLSVVTDGSGAIVARSMDHESFYGKPVRQEVFARVLGSEGYFTAIGSDGQELLSAQRRIAMADWRVFVWSPKRLLNRDAERLSQWLFVVVLLGLATSVAAAWVAASIIHRPMRRLIKIAGELRDGRAIAYHESIMADTNDVARALEMASFVIRARETALRESEDRTRTIMRELSHRTKNMLSIVQAMGRRSAASVTSLPEFFEKFEKRLAGLGRSQDLLVHSDWGAVSLRGLIESHLEPFTVAGDRLEVAGPELSVSPHAAQSIGMAVHELATNATKYGAWSGGAGKVRVDWRVEPSERGGCFVLSWSETDGPPCVTPVREGFGSAVIRRLAPSGLGGEAMTTWDESGVKWTLRAPMSALRA